MCCCQYILASLDILYVNFTDLILNRMNKNKNVIDSLLARSSVVEYSDKCKVNIIIEKKLQKTYKTQEYL